MGENVLSPDQFLGKLSDDLPPFLGGETQDELIQTNAPLFVAHVTEKTRARLGKGDDQKEVYRVRLRVGHPGGTTYTKTFHAGYARRDGLLEELRNGLQAKPGAIIGPMALVRYGDRGFMTLDYWTARPGQESPIQHGD